MFTRYLKVGFMLLGTMVAFVQGAQADIDWQVKKTLKTSGQPLATAFSEEGQKFFVLNAGGKIEIFSDQGEPIGTLEVGATAKSLTASASGEQLFVTDQESQAIRIITLDFVVPLNLTGAPTKGPEDAPVTITIFSDFQCPYCSKIVPLLEQILEHNPKTVKLVYMNFPLQSHRYSQQASLTALAAGRQGKFWPMHDKILSNYNSLNEAKFPQFATELGLDTERFNHDLKDPALRDKINADLAEGEKAGVHGTPTLFVNGRLLKNKSLPGIQELIDAELKKTAK